MATRKPANNKNTDLHKELHSLVEKMIEQMEQGGTWIKSWSSPNGAPQNFKTKKEYRGFNSLYLPFVMAERGYTAPYFLTFKQAKELGGAVKKGSKSIPVYFYKFLEVNSEDNNTLEIFKKTVPLLRQYRVFNIEDIEDIEYELPEALTNDNARYEKTDAFVAATGADIRYGGDRAYFRPSNDYIQMPLLEYFVDSDNFYGTLLHEITHWSGHVSRLNREDHKKWGDETYAFEELIAELGAVFLCNHLGISIENNQHPEYLSSWIRKLKDDPQALWKAASKAQLAFDHIKACSEVSEDVKEAA